MSCPSRMLNCRPSFAAASTLIHTEWCRGSKGNFGDAASYLVEKGANANDVYVDEGGDRHSLLMNAIIVENVPFAELLVKHGADVHVTDEQGVTTLIQVPCSCRLRLRSFQSHIPPQRLLVMKSWQCYPQLSYSTGQSAQKHAWGNANIHVRVPE